MRVLAGQPKRESPRVRKGVEPGDDDGKGRGRQHLVRLGGTLLQADQGVAECSQGLGQGGQVAGAVVSGYDTYGNLTTNPEAGTTAGVLDPAGQTIPLLDLRDVVRLQAPRVEGADREIVVIERGDRQAGLVVDQLVGQDDIVVKPFDAARDALGCFSGATILPDGAPALIMDLGSLL